MSLDNFAAPNLSGIPTDWVPVVASDDADNTGQACIGLYIQVAGTWRYDSGGERRRIA